MLAVGFPTRYEAEDFFKTVTHVQAAPMGEMICFTAKLNEAELVIAILGMGTSNAAKHARAVCEKFSVEFFILAGFGGALTPALKRGQILLAQECASEETMTDIKLLAGFDVARLHTSEKLITTAEEKSKLAASTGCQFVDMETAAVLPVAQEFGAELISVRAISDLADEDLPADVLERSYDFIRAKETPARLAFYLLTHPHRISSLTHFLKPLPSVRKRLTNFLVELIQYLF
ncbi:MAG: hypothetical protein ACOY3I_09940 [Verrucomicrobiota bacterium]